LSKNIKYAVLIPAYKPDEKFVDFVTLLRKQNIPVVVVDDGSKDACKAFFDSAEKVGCVVVHHEVNGGKGKALRTGFEEIIRLNSKGAGYNYVVTADCDGQHDIEAINTVVEAAEESLLSEKGPAFIIGGRFRDEGEKIPFKSKLGNGFTRLVFKIATGLSIHDTQTGLRAIPETLFGEMLKVKGDRYEYEMNMLLQIKTWHVHYKEVPIKTIYYDNNAGTHFHPLRDSFLIISQILKFALSSMVSFLFDYVLFAILTIVFGWKYAVAYAVARVLSGILNYILNAYTRWGYKLEEQFSGLFAKYGLFYELGHSWNLSAYEI
jgi:glycosyltransferase involved in cell wall biosynthesis